MSRRIFSNLGLFLFSLLLAFFFWAVATESEDPTKKETLASSVEVEIEGLPEDRVTYDAGNMRVLVTVRAPTSIWNNLRSDDFHAYIDLSDVPTGTLEVPIQVELRSEPTEVTEITEISPGTVEITVEELAEKDVPVTVNIQGTPAVGFVMNAYETVPQAVRVRGPASFVQQVFKAQVVVSVSDKQGDVRSDYQAVPLDENDNLVAQVEIAPKTVTVNVPIEPLGYLRDLAVTPALQGQPAPDYRVSNLVVRPPVVKVFGPPEAVRKTSGYLQTQPINMTGITQSITTPVGLQMPEGLTVVDPPRAVVSVTLRIEVIRSGLTLEVTPTIQGLSETLSATVELDKIVLILNGPLSIMEALNTEEDVQFVLDLTGLDPGDYSLVPDITVPSQVVIENVIPEAVPVRITEMPGEEEAEGTGP
jgi:YbbR domain-containing protein